MPSRDIWQPAAASYNASYFCRQSSWTNTPNYGNVPKRSLPINIYNDLKSSVIQQNFYAGQRYTLLSTGATTQAYPAGYLYTGQQIRDEAYNFCLANGFVNSANSVYNSTMVKAFGKVADVKVNLAVTIAEAGKSVDFILSVANRLDRAYRAFRKGRFREVATLLGISPSVVHKTWLEYKYAWLTMLMDVRGVAEAYAQHVVGRPPRFTVSVPGHATFTYVYKGTYLAYGGGGTGTYVQSATADYSCRIVIDVEVTNPNRSYAQQLGLTNPALFAWEKFPFSFVFDWFISVGSYLEALTAFDGVTVKRAMRSNCNAINYAWTQPATNFVNGGYLYFSGDRQRYAAFRDYARSPFVPNVFDIYPPSNISSLSWNRLFTGLALIKAQR